mgnify:CR=1 FL=1|tara:strand:- start:201 stop:404 length:204 start_codon:yes stop_codon:yes gene_type:complete
MLVVWWEKEKKSEKISAAAQKIYGIGIKNEEYDDGFVFFVSSSSRATNISSSSSIRSNSETKTNREE